LKKSARADAERGGDPRERRNRRRHQAVLDARDLTFGQLHFRGELIQRHVALLAERADALADQDLDAGGFWLGRAFHARRFHRRSRGRVSTLD